MDSPTEKADRRHEYLAAGATSLEEYERTGIAYAMKDVEKYILGIAAGKQPLWPRPVTARRRKT